MTEIYLNIIFEYRQATFHHFSNISYLSPTTSHYMFIIKSFHWQVKGRDKEGRMVVILLWEFIS
jgi:hypothetical protein